MTLHPTKLDLIGTARQTTTWPADRFVARKYHRALPDGL